MQNLPSEPGKTPVNQPTGKNNGNRRILLNLVSILLPILLIGLFFFVNDQSSNTADSKSYAELVTLTREGKVSEIEVTDDSGSIAAKVYKNDSKNREEVTTEKFANVNKNQNTNLIDLLREDIKDSKVRFGTNPGEVDYKVKEAPLWASILANPTFQTILLLVGTLVIGVILLRRLGELNSKSISFGTTRSRFYDQTNEKKVTFADVAGNEEAKQELSEIVDFLRRPEDYTKMGAKIPRGVLLTGYPGNGKTLMARAIAGEAQVPFMYVSGSEFVEMFVGVGASRVRDLFKQAKKRAPCLIFIDEIDAVGRQRGAGLGGGNDEREQTLNQILVEMDGFDPADYVIVIGATNRPDVLDPALLRPGRFDRQVTVTAPDRKEREQILILHAKNKHLAPNVDLSIIAKRTAGFSGADLQNLLNEAAILAVREKSDIVTDKHLRESIEKSLLGPSLKSKMITETQKRLTAYHEAGHALIQTVIPEANKVQKITIIPRGRAAGYTFSAEKDNDAITKKRSEFLAEISSLFGGYVAEETVFGEVSTGGSNDLQKATDMARDMVTKYGMSGLGPISYDQGKGMSFLGRDMMDKQNYSEESAKLIDKEIRQILDGCYSQAQQIIKKHIQDLNNIANTLIEKEVIEYEELNKLIAHLLPN